MCFWCRMEDNCVDLHFALTWYYHAYLVENMGVTSRSEWMNIDRVYPIAKASILSDLKLKTLYTLVVLNKDAEERSKRIIEQGK